jgi:hypothetical protein
MRTSSIRNTVAAAAITLSLAITPLADAAERAQLPRRASIVARIQQLIAKYWTPVVNSLPSIPIPGPTTANSLPSIPIPDDRD